MFTGVLATSLLHNAQNMKFPIKDFVSKCDQIRSFLVQCQGKYYTKNKFSLKVFL